MRANILFCLYFFMGLAVQLQAQVTVTGKVIDEQQQPVPYAQYSVTFFARFCFSWQEVSVMKKARLVSMSKKQGMCFASIILLCYCFIVH